jgi:hypothetical protein
VVLESREIRVEDPHANRNHLGAAYTGGVISAIVANAASNDGTVIVGALLAGLGAGWMIGELSEASLPGHAYVVKDAKSGEVYTVVQPTPGNDWLLPPGTEVFVIGESRTARVVPEADESWFWERPEPAPLAPPVVWREPEARTEFSGRRP